MKLKWAGKDATPVEGEQAQPRAGANNLGPAIVVALGLVAGGFFLSQGGNDPGAGEVAHATVEEEATHGPVQNLEPITLNLADGRYLKVGLALQLADLEGHEELPSAKALDVAIDLFGEYSMRELREPRTRELVKKRLSEQVAAAYVDPESTTRLVTKVYFTEFVMQ